MRIKEIQGNTFKENPVSFLKCQDCESSLTFSCISYVIIMIMPMKLQSVLTHSQKTHESFVHHTKKCKFIVLVSVTGGSGLLSIPRDTYALILPNSLPI